MKEAWEKKNAANAEEQEALPEKGWHETLDSFFFWDTEMIIMMAAAY